MTKSGASFDRDMARFEGLTSFELRQEWERRHGVPPPVNLSRELLLRDIAYHLQEQTQGGLSRTLLRSLGVGGSPAGREQPPVAKIVLKPGTRLVREWNGTTHTVLVHADGFEWSGKRYRSLSVIARAITGAHWSGPRFFGLNAARKNRDAPS